MNMKLGNSPNRVSIVPVFRIIAIVVLVVFGASFISSCEKKEGVVEKELGGGNLGKLRVSEVLFSAMNEFRDRGIQKGLQAVTPGFNFNESGYGNPFVWKAFFASSMIIPHRAQEGILSAYYYNPFADGAIYAEWSLRDGVPSLDKIGAHSGQALIEGTANETSDIPRYFSNPKRTPQVLFPRHLSLDTEAIVKVLGTREIKHQSLDETLVGFMYLYKWVSEGVGRVSFLQNNKYNPKSRELILKFKNSILKKDLYNTFIGSGKGATWESIRKLPIDFRQGIGAAYALVTRDSAVVIFIDIERPAYYVSLEFSKSSEYQPKLVQIGQFVLSN